MEVITLEDAARMYEFFDTSIRVNDFPNDMPKPSEYSGEDIYNLKNRTYLVEFTVPSNPQLEFIKPLVVSILIDLLGYDPDVIEDKNPALFTGYQPFYKIRGWFIKGDGIVNNVQPGT